MEQRRENDYKRRNCYSSLASHLLLSKHKKEQGGSFYALSVLYLPSSAWCEQTYSAVCTWNYSWLCSMLLFSRMILTTQPRHSIGRKTWLFTIQLCRWSFIPLSQEENRNFSVNKWSTLIGWYWDQSDLTQHIRGKERKRERKRERAKLGWAQSHLDENLQVVLGLSPKLSRLLHCLAPLPGKPLQGEQSMGPTGPCALSMRGV